VESACGVVVVEDNTMRINPQAGLPLPGYGIVLHTNDRQFSIINFSFFIWFQVTWGGVIN
jgi:hypothetical protein